jgi:D-alanyl-D-alanine carboxypeptidase (penicillin-binding protein 5/6)
VLVPLTIGPFPVIIFCVHPRLLIVAVAVALASIASVATQSQVEPTHAAGGRAASLAASATGQAARTGAAARTELRRHQGFVTGNGNMVFLANRTEFRPRRRVSLPPRVRARSWVVVDLASGRLLAEHDARRRLPQASTMKLLTAVTAVDNRRHLRLPHKVTRFEAHQTCTCAGLAIGHRYAFKTLLEGMLLPSGNDSAEALAGSHRGGRHAFYAAMNRTAHRLGARDTEARNASGLTAAGSHSSARDLVLLLRAALHHRVVRHVLAMPSARIASVDGRRRHTIWRGTDYVNLYPRALGKSGYTTPAGNTLVVATRLRGHHIAVAVMHAPYGYVTSDARRLTEWAAANFAGLARVGRLPHS